MNSLTANNRLSQQLVVSVAEHRLLWHECRLPNHLAVSNHRELYLTVGGELCRNLTAGFVTEEDFMFMLFVGSQKHSALSIFAKTTRMTERAQEPEPQSVRETRPVRNFYVGTNDPRVILCLTRQAEELESRGLYRRAATVWMAAFRESHSQPERNNFLAHRERCLRKSSKRAASGEEWYLSGNYVGA